MTRIPVETFGAEAPARWEPRLDDEHNAYAWCTFTEAQHRLSWPGDPGTLHHVRATVAVLRRALLEDRTAPRLDSKLNRQTRAP